MIDRRSRWPRRVPYLALGICNSPTKCAGQDKHVFVDNESHINVLMWCDNKDMLRDRVESYRHVNVYNPHYDRHILGPLRFTGEKDGLWTFDLSYSLFQTSLEGESRLFSVGRYRIETRLEGGPARLKTVTVIADTGLVPSLLATPI